MEARYVKTKRKDGMKKDPLPSKPMRYNLFPRRIEADTALHITPITRTKRLVCSITRSVLYIAHACVRRLGVAYRLGADTRTYVNNGAVWCPPAALR